MKYELNGFYNCDCMEAMKEFPDKYFELAIVDPPYGNGSAPGAHSSELNGGGADFSDRARSRFGGLFDRYHIGKETDAAERGYL